jgi:heat shock protein HtpX
MSVNACAMGKHTIAVTKGAMKTFSEEELKAILSHEVAHILNMDTMALIYTMIGNGIFTAIIVMVKNGLLADEQD